VSHVPARHVRCQAPGQGRTGHVRRATGLPTAWLSGFARDDRQHPGQTGHVRCLAPDVALWDMSALPGAKA
jgi:hypothetical protein